MIGLREQRAQNQDMAENRHADKNGACGIDHELKHGLRPPPAPSRFPMLATLSPQERGEGSRLRRMPTGLQFAEQQPHLDLAERDEDATHPVVEFGRRVGLSCWT